MKPKYRVFVTGVIEGLSDEDAAIRAGYSPRSVRSQCNRMRQNAEVCTAIEAGNKKAVEKSELTRAFVINSLIDVANACKASDRPGTATPALGLLGKHLSMFIDRSEVTVTGETMQFLEAVIGIIDRLVTDQVIRGQIAAELAELQDSLDD